MDTSLFRTFKLTEKSIGVPAEAYNLKNTPHFASRAQTLTAKTSVGLLKRNTGWAYGRFGVPLWFTSGLLASFDPSSGADSNVGALFFAQA